MKQGIALFLLYFYEGQWTGKGITAMAGKVKSAMNFSPEEYQKGIYGFDGAKQKLMTSYKDRYSRRNAFRAELKSYG